MHKINAVDLGSLQPEAILRDMFRKSFYETWDLFLSQVYILTGCRCIDSVVIDRLIKLGEIEIVQGC